MNKKALRILLLASITTGVAGCNSEITGSANLANSYENQRNKEEEALKEERLENKIESIVNVSKEQADYVYEKLFFNSNLDKSEKYLIQDAVSKFESYWASTANIPEELVISLYDKAKELYETSNSSTEQDIKNLLASYYISRYSSSYYKFYEEYRGSDNDNNLDTLSSDIYDLLAKYHSDAVPNGIANAVNEESIFYNNTVFGDAEVIDVKDDFNSITGEKDTLKYQYLQFRTSKDKVTAENIEGFIENVVKQSSSSFDYRGIYLEIDNNSKKIYFNPITESQRKNRDNRRHGVNYIDNIIQDEIFEYNGSKYIVENNEIVKIR